MPRKFAGAAEFQRLIWMCICRQIISGWCQLKYFLEFSPLFGEDESILTNIFQRGLNHQLDLFFTSIALCLALFFDVFLSRIVTVVTYMSEEAIRMQMLEGL